MSIRIMSDIWEMPFPPTDKLVFLALADCANDEGLAWPSIATIARKSGVSERTVQRSIRSGEKAGLIRREEVFGKGCKYYFTPNQALKAEKKQPKVEVPVEPMQGYLPAESHYIYRIDHFETGEFYVGARSCYGLPDDDSYMGSGVWVKERLSAGSSLSKTIVRSLESRSELAAAEVHYVDEARQFNLCQNRKSAAEGSLRSTGYTPDTVSPRQGVAPTNEALTPDTVSPKPSRTITVSKANALPTRRAKPFQKPDGVDQDVWNDFLDHRKAKRAPISNTAMTAIEREAAKAGWPLNRALAEIVSRNWQSFKAEWVREKQNGHYANQNDGMGITERAAHRALSEITGGDAGFTGRGSQMPQANASGSYRTIDAMPDAVRSIGYAGG